ncbi:MAG: hypothetical protein FWH29_10715 [Methanobrevibacter sp.]|nr:hypothetical protein [Methanobrevibacter sp.]
MTSNVNEDMIITTPIGTKLNLRDMVIKNPNYANQYEPLFEIPTIWTYLSWLEGEDREDYIRLEEQQNPVQFKAFREKFPECFE